MRLFLLFLSLSITKLVAQTMIPIPETLSGSSINLTIANGTKSFFAGTTTNTIGYNGNYLGKTLILQKGQNVTLNVNNQLGETTTTHWHGLHVTPANDGSPHNTILAGTTWSPSFTVRDKAAMYWYHPHLHGTTLKQVVKGAAGLIIVRDDEEALLNLPRTYGVDDIPLICQFQTFDNATKQIVENDEFDNTVLVNGTVNGKVNCPAQVVRLRLLNASSHRVFQFGFNNNLRFSQIGSDDGLLNAPLSMTRLTLGSGERADILVNLAGLSGQTLSLWQYGTELPQGYPGGAPMMGMQAGPLDNMNFSILQIGVVAATPNPVQTIPTALTNNTAWSTAGAATRSLALSAQPMMSMTNFFINNQKYDEQRTDFTTQQNNVEIWTITNGTMMAHPLHIHGNHFFVLEVNGQTPAENLRGRKDVVIVPPSNGSVKLIMKYEDFGDATMPYMYHCHILSHEDGGMMGQFKVSSAAVPVELKDFRAKKQAQDALLTWETASEINNKGYFVERSYNGSDWLNIGFVKGVGNSNTPQYYNYLDKNLPRELVYYRLRQVDVDQKETQTKTVSLDFRNQAADKLRLYPNPAQSQLSIDNTQGRKVEIINPIGQVLLSSINQDPTTVVFDLRGLANGFYFVRCGSETQHFFKL